MPKPKNTKLSLADMQRDIAHFKTDDLLLFANIFHRLSLWLEYQANRKSRLWQQHAQKNNAYHHALLQIADVLDNGDTEHNAIHNVAHTLELCSVELSQRLARIKENNKINEKERHVRNKNIIMDLLNGLDA